MLANMLTRNRPRSALSSVLKGPAAASGYMHCARTHVRLDEVLDSIRDNLRREQKTVMELNCAQPRRGKAYTTQSVQALSRLDVE